MEFKDIFLILSLLALISFSHAIDFSHFSKLEGVPQPLPPMPSHKAVMCLNELTQELFLCRNRSLLNWNITDYSTIGDVCCAQWDAFDCDLDYVAKSKCNSEELDEVNEYFEDLIDFYNTKTCHLYTRASTHCVLPSIAKITDEKPPLPSPLAIDCLGNINPEVRLGCAKSALINWNITKKHHPLRNICCASWEDIDCLDEIVKLRCPSSEVTATESYFQQVEDWLDNAACKNATYHSANCSTSAHFKSSPKKHKLKQEKMNSIIPMKFEPKPVYSANTFNSENSQQINLNTDYINFLMNYVMSVFPHLLNLMVLLAFILVIVIVAQCLIIGRQVKQDRLIQSLTFKGYHKIDI